MKMSFSMNGFVPILRFVPSVRVGLCFLAFLVFGLVSRSLAATVAVDVGDNFFSPSSVTINVNDTVSWSWTGVAQHSSTSNTGVWDSGIHGRGFTFSQSFTSAGSFPYFCRVHPFQTGSISVQSANSPPTITINSPPDNSVFSAPASFTLAANASDPDGTVSQVEFFRGSTSLGIDTTSPYSVSVSNLAAGTYTLSAVATDDRGATNASPIANVSVVTPVPIVLSDSQQLSATEFRFSFTANPGLSYVVERSASLTNFTAISTNTATGSDVTFSDNAATNNQNFYRVRLLPNP
jgi:plastocyanin